MGGTGGGYLSGGGYLFDVGVRGFANRGVMRARAVGRSFLPQRGRDAEGAEIELTVRSSLRGNELAAEQSF